jgi:hypothetical protein
MSNTSRAKTAKVPNTKTNKKKTYWLPIKRGDKEITKSGTVYKRTKKGLVYAGEVKP